MTKQEKEFLIEKLKYDQSVKRTAVLAYKAMVTVLEREAKDKPKH